MPLNLRSIAPILLTCLCVPIAGHGGDDDAPHPVGTSSAAAPAGSVAANMGAPLRLDAQQQRNAGIAVQVLVATQQRPEFTAYAKVVDIQPLLDLSLRQRSLQADLAVAGAALAASGREAARLGKLHQQDAVSARGYQQAQSLASADQARSSAARQQLAMLRHQALQLWGQTLADWALDSTGRKLERLLAREDVLVLVALPTQRSLAAGTNKIALSRQSSRARIQATLVSAAPRTGELTQGETWFFVTPAADFRTGMRLDAWIPQSEAVEGVEFPVTAVLWRSGQPWVYVQAEEGSFARRLIPTYHDKGDTWFVTEGVRPGERLVVAGAQLLLSEEFRGQIPDEGDD